MLNVKLISLNIVIIRLQKRFLNSTNSAKEERNDGEVDQSENNCQSKTEYVTDNKQQTTTLSNTCNLGGN